MKTTTLLMLLAVLAPGLASAQANQEEYQLGPDSNRHPGVPAGTVTHYTWSSHIFPGTTRDYWVYVPAQYSPQKPACLMVFQDGGGFIKEDGRERAPIVFDNLIAKHDMPVTVGIFIDPGVLKASSPDQQDRFNRSFEYDGMSDRYARFLLEEIIPEVAKHYHLSTDPDDRAIAGLSSGGICAFTVAWNRPDAFHRVLSFIGSYTDLRGGDVYPNLIRKTEPKPLRVFLQDGSHDLNIYAGDWWLSNQSVASALEFAGYDVKFVTGDKDHDMDQGGAILPDALRWLWRDYPQPITKPGPTRSGLGNTAILDPASDWKLVSDGAEAVRSVRGKSHWFMTVTMLDFDPPFWGTAGIAADGLGNVLFSDTDQSRIYKAGAGGGISLFQDNAPGARGLAVGANNRVYACETKSRRIVRYGHGEPPKTLADGVDCQDLAVNRQGGVYYTDPVSRDIGYVSPGGTKRVVYQGIPFPNGMVLSPDQALLYVSDPTGRWVWSFATRQDGSLANAEPFYRLEAGDESSVTGALGLTVDTLGYLYVATRAGIQVCDQPGRVVKVIDSPPAAGPLQGLAFGGSDFQDLYAIVSNRVYKRHLLRKGVAPGAPVKPPVPHL